jgi:hypothetical protein
MMPYYPTCAKTGCALFVAQNAGYVWGDMHQLTPTIWIFNAACDREGRPMWQHEPVPEGTPAYTLEPHADFFERRGVFVMERSGLLWNKALAEYLGLSPESARA